MMKIYPVAIAQDRYGGAYSGGGWLAIACATEIFSGNQTRVDFCLGSDVGPSGSDIEADTFRVDPPSWIAVGSTPDKALENLWKSHS